MRWLDGITDTMDMNLSKLWDMVKDTEAWHAAFHGVSKRHTRQRTEQQLSSKQDFNKPRLLPLFIEKIMKRNFLGFLWLRIHWSETGIQVGSLSRKTPQTVEQLSPSTMTTEHPTRAWGP